MSTSDELRLEGKDANGIGAFTEKGFVVKAGTVARREVTPSAGAFDGDSSLVPPSQQYQVTEIENIVEACNRIMRQIMDDDEPCSLSRELLVTFNKLVLADLDGKNESAGEIPTQSIVVGNVYRGAPRKDCEHLMDKMCEWINGESAKSMKTENSVSFAVLHAVLAHLYFVWIHPFEDGNGRTARLIEILILGRAGVPLACSYLLSNHYNKTRPEYYRHLEIASKQHDRGGVVKFILYAIQGLRDGLAEQVGQINDHQWKSTWTEHVYKSFEGRANSSAAKRQRQIALDMSKFGPAGCDPRHIKTISEEVAVHYAKLERDRRSSDIRKLLEMGLLEYTLHGGGQLPIAYVRTAFSRILEAQNMPQRNAEQAASLLSAGHFNENGILG